MRVVAYIDGANLHKGIESLGWKLDYKKFRGWLRTKFGVTDAVIFLGLIQKNADLYSTLQSHGYRLVFKAIVVDADGRVKGNCDADLVLHATVDALEARPNSVVLVSSDGDYAPLAKLWVDRKIKSAIVSPSESKKCSVLLKRTGVPIVYLDSMRHKLSYGSK